MKNLILLITLFISAITHAQQLNLISQYTENQSLINPAALSIDYLKYNQNKSAGVSYRYQWTGIEDAPQTAFARFEYIRESDNLAVFGGNLIQDKVGATSQTGLFGRYAYQLKPSIGSDLIIGLGLTAGIVQYRIDANELEFEADDQLQGNTPQSWVPDVGMGANIIFYPEAGTKWYAGFSIPQTIGLDASFDTEVDSEVNIERFRHFYLSGGAIIPMGRQGFMEPSVWVKKANGIPLHIDFNIRQKFVNNFWFGLGYSTANVAHLDTGILLSQLIGLQDALLRVGYAFDYNIGEYSRYLGATHEISVSFSWN